ncbi:hypothetical protein ACTXOW_14080 [Corynebacterium variabile]|uniref:hypothetical protein n=1 Tax=Corynebacterium variabile TaxID=1727 RepID=UPI003FD4ECC1
MSGALFGQGLNFLAMLLPIIGQETGQLAYLMLPLALSTVLSRTSILGFHSRYLTVPEHLRRTATTVSFASLFLTSLMCVVVASILTVMIPESGAAGIAGWTALLVLSNGVYFMAVAVVTQEQRMIVYSTARLWYGVVNVVVTSIVVFAVPFAAGLVFVAVINPLVGALLILLRTGNRMLPELWRDRRNLVDRTHRRYLESSGQATGATLLSECGFQIQGFLTPLLGQYQEAWAVVVRLTGGFGTLAQQVIAPTFEAKIAAAIRDGDRSTTAKWCRVCVVGGIGLGAVCAAVQAGALVFSLHGHESLTVTTLIMSSVYCVATLAMNLSVKIPLMKGHDRLFLFWSSGRLALLLCLLATPSGVLLTGVVVVQTLAALVFLSVASRPSKR